MTLSIAMRRGLFLALSSVLFAVAGCGDEGCPVGFESCDGLCSDTASSRLHCGACGVACGAGEICSAGMCELGCPDGQEACGGECVFTDADVSHCGGCGNACEAGEVCMAGSCDTQCATGFVNCGGSCRDLGTDSGNCGGCGIACGDGERCVDGDCEATCGSTQIVCDGLCADIATDAANCGRCGVTCGAGEICDAGSCTVFCADGLSACPDGSCRDFDNDVRNCGRCAAPCGAGEACALGVCTQTCSGGTPDLCDGSCVDLQSNPNFCGDCMTECPLGAVCSLGVCELTCAPGLTDCGGACVDLDSDPNNCSACGTVCMAPASGGVPACAAGSCAVVCPDGAADCNGDVTDPAGDGCEVAPLTDIVNCGACGNVCNVPNASQACVDGACGVGMCDAGFGDCDLIGANGCETETNTDDLNCGGCGTACAATEECMGGTCSPIVFRGDTCADPLVLSDGTQTLSWRAMDAPDVFLTPPAACSTQPLIGPDIVFSYTATSDTTVDVELGVPTSNRYSVIVTTTCTDEATAITCDSDFTPAEVTVSFRVTSGTTYYVWIRDTTSGSAVLPNPIDVTVRSPATGTILGLDPAPIGTCTPGSGGLLGASVTDFPTGTSEFPFWAMADEVAPASGGYIYYGDTLAVWRVRKDGTSVSAEDVDTLSGIGSAQRGYGAFTIGSNIYTLDDTTSSSLTRIWQITADNGATWMSTAVNGALPTGFETFLDAIDAATADGNTVYFPSEETTASRTVRTEIYSLDASATLPAPVTLLAESQPGLRLQRHRRRRHVLLPDLRRPRPGHPGRPDDLRGRAGHGGHRPLVDEQRHLRRGHLLAAGWRSRRALHQGQRGRGAHGLYAWRRPPGSHRRLLPLRHGLR